MSNLVSVEDYGFDEEKGEEARHHRMKTGWPSPLAFFKEGAQPQMPARWRLVLESQLSVEEVYFQALDLLREECEFAEIDKITDVFAASEESSFFGVAQQRLGLQQDKVSQFLATIGKMVKELFQLVREIRVLDERLEYYRTSYAGSDASEITLKGYWIDLVEGGAKNPASVYGMARELEFTTLPDVFFGTPPIKSAHVDDYVDRLKFNRKLREVLKRKLKTFLVWKEHTQRELQDRRVFTIKYLRQHYDVIKMYMVWAKPYLKYVKRLEMDQKKLDTVDLIKGFEGSIIEIEIAAKKPFPNSNPLCYGVILLHYEYRTRAELKFQGEGYQRGPVHIGRVKLTYRAYTWTPAQLAAYKKYRTDEDFDLLASIDESVKAAYTALGAELERYLTEAGEMSGPEWAANAEKEAKMPSAADPFTAVVKGLGELISAFGSNRPKTDKIICSRCKTSNKKDSLYCSKCANELRKLSKAEAIQLSDSKEAAEKFLQDALYKAVKNLKGQYKMPY